ncbi:MAG: tol-pal system protein YbgF [Fulvimonas sp.]|nr:tol-pal system protein YbgF [Fulvimonas sp.]
MASAVALAMLCFVASPARAQETTRLSLAERVSRLEQQAQNQNQGTALVNQLQALQSQLQQAQGQIEELQHQLQELKDKNKAQYVDLDARLTRLEGGAGATAANASSTPAALHDAAPGTAAAASTASAPASAATVPQPAKAAAAGTNAASAAPAPTISADEQAAYDAAFKALRAGDYVTASRGFRDFIQQHPSSALAPNAWYWLGESYYVTMNYPVAREAFQRLLTQFPQSEKAPDALLKLGYCQLELKQTDAGKATLQSVISKYPGSKAAGLAQERLRRLTAPAG